MMPKNTYNIDMAVDDPVEEIRLAIQKALPLVDAFDGVTITIRGYGNDPRELWEIPEVETFAKLLVAEGMLGIMNAHPDMLTAPWIGALGLYLMSKGLMPKNNSVSREEMNRYFEAIDAGNGIIFERYGDGRPAGWLKAQMRQA